jgi:hypothetical protein
MVSMRIAHRFTDSITGRPHASIRAEMVPRVLNLRKHLPLPGIMGKDGWARQMGIRAKFSANRAKASPLVKSHPRPAGPRRPQRQNHLAAECVGLKPSWFVRLVVSFSNRYGTRNYPFTTTDKKNGLGG